MCLQGREGWQLPGEGGVGKGPVMASPSEFQEGINPADTLISNSWLPQLGEDKFVLFSDTKCW